MNIAFIPIDNRPVCYTLPEQVCAMNSSINLFMPERKYLGSLTKYADVDKIFEWLEKIPQVDAIVMCLDTVAYGGLISSRRCPDTFDEIKNRVENLKSILEKKNAKIYAFSSIMRISNNNVNEEEKEYWDKWGKKIFDYSYQTHKLGTESCISNIIPSEILDDYLATRKRNFEINKLYLEYQKQGLFDTLVFSKDDCAEYGFNVQEAQVLEKLGGFIKTGADEIPLTLLARAVVKFFNAKMQRCKDVKSFTEPVAQSRHCECERSNPVNSKVLGRDYYLDDETPLKISPIFLAPEYKDLISNYEDVSIEKSVKGQLELAGCKVCEPDEADILLYVNNFEDHQGEIVMKVPTKPFSKKWQRPEKPYMIADVRYANGADNEFVKQLFEVGLGDNFYGYSAWNTSANSLGSLICGAVVKFFDAETQRCKDAKSFTEPVAQSRHCECERSNPVKLNTVITRSDERRSNPIQFNNDENACNVNSKAVGQNYYPDNKNFLKLQTIRFLDDWAYQANVRQELNSPDEKLVKEKMKPYEKMVFGLLGVAYNISYKFTWNRLFEVEICILSN